MARTLAPQVFVIQFVHYNQRNHYGKNVIYSFIHIFFFFSVLFYKIFTKCLSSESKEIKEIEEKSFGALFKFTLNDIFIR